MPSSTSSSSERIPEGAWLRTWIAALLAFVVATAALEALGRALGHRSMVVDTKALWSLERDRVYERGPRTVVVLGASRMQLGFSTDEFRRRLPGYSVVQLSANGRYPIATLLDLAEDEDFNGVVICALSALALAPDRWYDQQRLVDYYHRQWTLASKIDRIIATRVELGLVAVNPYTRYLKTVSRAVRSKPLPKPYYMTLHADRSREADYAVVDVERKRAKRLRSARGYYLRENGLTPEVWLAGIPVIEQAVQAIRARGGEVVFVRMPTWGEHWELDEAHFPRRIFWDGLAERTSAVTIHFRDVAGMQVDCPDWSHLDTRDRARFTAALLLELQARSVLSPVREL